MDVHIEKLTKDLKEASYKLSDKEARFVVDLYYITQEARKRAGNQIRSMPDEPHELLTWFFQQNKIMESQLKGALDRYSETKPIGRWAKSLFGIGPVISAGLIAHIDIKKAVTAGDIYRFGGVDPTSKWEKKQKRPWNADLKTLIWKIGQSFMKFKNRENCYYGPYYKEYKAFYKERNDSGGNRERALKEASKYDPKKEAYKVCMSGKLPKGHVDAQARRKVAKLFLSHFHEVWYEDEFKTKAPACFAIAHLGHVHYIPPPHRNIPPPKHLKTITPDDLEDELDDIDDIEDDEE
jgi:hypothetical protein